MREVPAAFLSRPAPASLSWRRGRFQVIEPGRQAPVFVLSKGKSRPHDDAPRSAMMRRDPLLDRSNERRLEAVLPVRLATVQSLRTLICDGSQGIVGGDNKRTRALRVVLTCWQVASSASLRCICISFALEAEKISDELSDLIIH